MKVNEIFYGLQGEGRSAGKPTLFIRLSGCNLRCSFCDTKYHVESREITELDEHLLSSSKHWTITGGEPLLQQKAVDELISKYKPDEVEIETNGTIKAEYFILDGNIRFNCSPKEKRTQLTNRVVEPSLLSQIKFTNENHLDTVKFVYVDEKSEDFVARTIKKYEIAPRNVWIMPEGATRKEQKANMEKVWEYCTENGFNFSPRLHVLVYDDKKGV